jgi:flagellar biosynthesis/type III secretory pathway protein FliH
LEQQRRTAQYRFQEEYLERERQQVNVREPDYYRDPYYYSAPIYRYDRGGTYYEINEYGADLLRQAVNNGYQEGFEAGRADREDHWRADYRDSFAYRDANYGYNGYYLSQDDYNYYFREGFRRGYEDGYDSRYEYGRYNDGHYSVLDQVLGSILNFQRLR